MATTKISLKVGGSSFNIDLEEEFAKSLKPELDYIFKQDSNNEIKVLLEAFIKKSYDLYTLKKEIKSNIDKIKV